MISQDEIRRMVDLIVERFQPEKVILFGSYARGDAGPDSDVDLLVIKDTQGDPLDLAAEIATAVWRVPVAKDILVRSPRQVRRACAGGWSVTRQAAQNGRVLFDRSRA